MFTGTVATDLSDFETAELDDIDSYPKTVTQMGVCKESDIWRILYDNDEPDDTCFCGSRPNKQVRLNPDPDVHEVRPYTDIYGQHPQHDCDGTWMEKRSNSQMPMDGNIRETYQ